LVAKGFNQKSRLDYNETFAPVAKFAIRTILAEQPEGFIEKGKEHLVCNLKKALYGLKQAPRAWYEKIDKHLLSIGFVRSNADHGLYLHYPQGEYSYDSIAICG
jgi:Reverse transcriptase (RNA-dependent DNA polymerase)